MSKLSFRSLLEWIIALSVLLYLGSMVLVPDLYNVVPALLLLMSLVGFRYRKVVDAMEYKDWRLFSVFAGYFACFVVLVLLHGDDASSLDRPSRFLAAAIILTLLLRIRLAPVAMFAGAAIGGIGAGVFAGYQALVDGASRVTSFDNSIYFGNGALVLALVAFCGVVCGVHQRSWKPAWTLLYSAGFAGAMLALLLSGTRGGWLAVPVASMVFVWAYRRYILGHPGVLAASLGVLVVFGGTALSLDAVSQRVDVAVEQASDYFEGGEVKGSSVGLRLEMWHAGWLMYSGHPVLGVGDDNFDRELQALVDEGQVDESILTFRHLHNQFVDHAAKGGSVALLALLVVFLGPLVLFWCYMSSDNPLIKAHAVLGVTFVLTFMVFCLTQGMFSRNIGVMMYVIVPLLAWTVIRQAEAESQQVYRESEAKMVART
ncbi:hypothetical protein GCM10007071_28020 [Marinobacter zhanjiangensis]|uniref:O-antigen ligase-related domain-containing protein n=1 Tax=Marinobacter zhanjiangensis TaxID=578215 RepID=A0ABQ3B8I4_9GAMM|nr:hypothetical protein GCM10007071_28020 [Marinobacter zhanjiangensis]